MQERFDAGVGARMAARQFLLQAAYNAEGMQNLGFAYALLPALERIHGSQGEAIGAALLRHLKPVNTHPYLGAPLIGAVALLEAEGRIEQAERLKELASGPLAGIGDQFFWVGLKPALALVCVALVLVAGLPWGWLLFPLLFSVPQVVLRIWLLGRGMVRGRDALAGLAAAGLPRLATRLALIGGLAAGAIAVSTGHALGGLSAMVALPALALAGYVLVRRGVAPLVLIYLAAGMCLMLASLVSRG